MQLMQAGHLSKSKGWPGCKAMHHRLRLTTSGRSYAPSKDHLLLWRHCKLHWIGSSYSVASTRATAPGVDSQVILMACDQRTFSWVNATAARLAHAVRHAACKA